MNAFRALAALLLLLAACESEPAEVRLDADAAPADVADTLADAEPDTEPDTEPDAEPVPDAGFDLEPHEVLAPDTGPDTEPDADAEGPELPEAPDVVEEDWDIPSLDAAPTDAADAAPDDLGPEDTTTDAAPDDTGPADAEADVDLCPGSCVIGAVACPSLASSQTCVEDVGACGKWTLQTPCDPGDACKHGKCIDCPDAFGDDDGLPQEPAIDGLACVGVAAGIGPGLFGPASDITRASALHWLVRAMQWPITCPETPTFADIADSPSQCEIETAAAHGVVAPDAEGKANPAAPVTRAQLAAFILKAVDLAPEPTVASPFADTAGHPLEDYVVAAWELGVIGELGEGTFGPDQPATRAVTAFALWELAR